MATSKNSDPMGSPDYLIRARLASGSGSTPHIERGGDGFTFNVMAADPLNKFDNMVESGCRSAVTFGQYVAGDSSGSGSSDVVVCTVSQDTSYEAQAIPVTYRVGTETRTGAIMFPELAIGSKILKGTRVLGHIVKVPATGGND